MTDITERAHRTGRTWMAGMAAVLVVLAGTMPPAETSAAAPLAPACTDTADGSTAPRLAGAFVRPDVGPSQDAGPWWQATDWQALISGMRQMCMDQLILQWTARTWAGQAPPPGVIDPSWPHERQPDCVTADSAGRFVQPMYASSDPRWAANARQPITGPCGAVADRPVDQVGLALAAAKANGMRVWLGLQIDEPVWFDTANSNTIWLMGRHYPKAVGGQALLSRQIAQDLWARYGPGGSVGDYADTIAGIYLPFEPDNQFFPPASPQMANFGHYLREVSSYVHDLPGGAELGVMTSPVQHTQIGAAAGDPAQQRLRAAWTDTLAGWLSRSEVTVVAPQSGTGMQWTSTDDLGPWTMAAREAINRLPGGKNAGGQPVRLWADLEIYSIQGIDNMPVAHLVRDLAAINPAGAGIEKFVAFSVRNFDDAPGHPGARRNAAYRSAHQHYALTGQLPAQRVEPPAVLPGTRPATRLAAVLTGERGSTVSLQWRVVPSDGVRPDPATPDVPVRPPAGYQVFRDGLPIGQVPQPLTGERVNGFPDADTVSNGGMTGFTDTNLQPGRTYRYQVATFDPFGNLSPLTDAAEVIVPIDADSAVAAGQQSADLAVHAPYAITDTTVDPSKLTDGSADPPSIGDHLVRPNGTGGGELGTYPDIGAANSLNDGVVGTASHLDPAWSWRAASAGSYTMTIDLGGPEPVNTVRSAWLRETAMDIAPPQTVTVTYATADRPGATDWQRLGDAPDPAHPVFADPGVGWLTTSLGPGRTVAARWLRLTVAVSPGSAWTLASEVQVYGADGSVNTALPNARCARAKSCSRFVVAERRPRMARSTPATGGLLSAGQLTNGAGPTTAGPFLGWCFPESAACPTPHGSNPPGERFAITVDLGANQPIGSLSSVWLRRSGRAIKLPDAVRYSYRSAPDDGQADPGWIDADQIVAAQAGAGELADFTVTVPQAGRGPVRARWIRAEVSLPSGPGWIFAASVHVRTPRVSTPSQGQLPRIYPTRSTVNHGYDPGRPADPDTNNPTVPYPDGAAPPLPAVPATCSVATGASPCRGTDRVLAGVLTGIDPTTKAPYLGQPHRWWEPDSHWLHLNGAGGYDIIIPMAPTPVPLTELKTRFLRSVNGAVGLPASVDYYYTTSPDPVANPQAATWKWTRNTIQRPNLPPYLPDSTLLTWSYLATDARVPSQVTAVRIHINPTGPLPIFTDHAATHGWDQP